jgi:hypothetical protein
MISPAKVAESFSVTDLPTEYKGTCTKFAEEPKRDPSDAGVQDVRKRVEQWL